MEIWQEIRKNGENGARRLVSEYGNRLFAAALLLCSDDHDAEELVFRTFAQAVKGSRIAWRIKAVICIAVVIGIGIFFALFGALGCASLFGVDFFGAGLDPLKAAASIGIIGSAGVSAVPMAARVSNKVALDEDPTNFILMQAMGPNVSGVIGSAVVAGVLYTLCR